jgi:hypothetical protein
MAAKRRQNRAQARLQCRHEDGLGVECRLCKRVLPSGKSGGTSVATTGMQACYHQLQLLQGYTDSQSATSAERVSPPCDDSYSKQHRLAPPVDPKLHRRRLAMSPVEQLVL